MREIIELKSKQIQNIIARHAKIRDISFHRLLGALLSSWLGDPRRFLETKVSFDEYETSRRSELTCFPDHQYQLRLASHHNPAHRQLVRFHLGPYNDFGSLVPLERWVVTARQDEQELVAGLESACKL